MEHKLVDFKSLLFAERRILLRKLINKIAEYVFELSVLLENQEVCLYYTKAKKFIFEGVEQKISGSMDPVEYFDIILNYNGK